MSITKSTKKFKRIKRDHYPTHECAVDALLERVRFRRRICDPCCGPNRQILKAAIRHNHVALSYRTDIVYGFDFTKKDPPMNDYDIISNPPYGDRKGSLSITFIERSLEVTHDWGGKVAMLLPADFDNGYTRRHLFDEHSAFDCTVVLQNRVRIFDERSGTTNHNWFVWDWSRRPGPSRKFYNHISYGDL